MLTPFLLLKLFLRSRKNPAYRQRIAERFAFVNYPVKTNQPRALFHLVSVGETLAAIDIVQAFIKKYPDYEIIITSTTPTGSDRVKAAFGDKVQNYYLPFDYAFAQRRLLKQLAPDLIVLMETELWPNTLHYADKYQIPTVLMNARLSERSLKGYQKLVTLSAKMMAQISFVSAQYEADGNRFIELGLDKAKLQIAGSLKFDIKVKDEWLHKARTLNQVWQTAERFIWLAASTHKGEDEKILAAHQALLKVDPNAVLILVPRHPERFESVFQLSAKRFATIKRSTEQTVQDCQVIIGDSMGEMMAYYQVADLAFVGGSLVEHGGHNPLEPAALKKPILSGPHVFNFEHIFEQLVAVNGALMCKSSEDLAEKVIQLNQNQNQRDDLGRASHLLLAQLGGATDKTLSLLSKYLEPESN
ncbi:lipid IV(A) 3-deoxy-D-manno-octulosonic acid transferase [Catenovulum sp. SM1970]|nr:lipid IV(A) 3-deoxy-D-manno-octulosonic acid transferase [Marinifaba aquimaris]